MSIVELDDNQGNVEDLINDDVEEEEDDPDKSDDYDSDDDVRGKKRHHGKLTVCWNENLRGDNCILLAHRP